MKLELLILNNNRLSQLEEILELRNCSSLKSLSMVCNPLTQSEDYFEYVITFLPSLIYVDGKSKESIKCCDEVFCKFTAQLRQIIEKELKNKIKNMEESE
ncbi:unnamed protein product, partial [Hymenolepis diminuta]